MGSTIHKYQGYWMRSHSETRWAGMMDALGIKWLYEPGLVETRHGWYLPDFYLPGAGIYLEVKGPYPSEVEIQKAADLRDASGCQVAFAWGDMQFCGDRVSGGAVGLVTKHGLLRYSTGEFAELIQLGLGRRTFIEYLRAGIKRPHPGGAMVGDLLQERLLEMQGRSGAESARAEHHRILNAAKAGAHAQAARAEWAIGSFIRKNAAAFQGALS